MKAGDQAALIWLSLILLAFSVYNIHNSRLYDDLFYTELPEHLNADYCKCDAPPKSINTGRVVNGTLTSDSFYPWTAALYFMNDTVVHVFCTGAVISPSFVLTAAHCVDQSLSNSYVGVGFNQSSPQFFDALRNFKPMKSAIIQKGFRESSFVSDIALIELAEPFEFGEKTQIYPACLFGKNSYASDLLYAGYGSTLIRFKNKSIEIVAFPKREDSSSLEGLLERWWKEFEDSTLFHLKITDLKKVDQIDWLSKLWLQLKIIETSSEHSSMCFGDSGGPLLMEDIVNGTNRLFVIGVASGLISTKYRDGKISCMPGSVSFFTQLYPNLDFITNTAKKSGQQLCLGTGKKLIKWRLIFFWALIFYIVAFAVLLLIKIVSEEQKSGRALTATTTANHVHPHNHPASDPFTIKPSD